METNKLGNYVKEKWHIEGQSLTVNDVTMNLSSGWNYSRAAHPRMALGCPAPPLPPCHEPSLLTVMFLGPQQLITQVRSPVTYEAPVYLLVFSWPHRHSFRIPSLPVPAPASCVPASMTLNHFWELTGQGKEARDVGPSSDTQRRTSWGNADFSE